MNTVDTITIYVFFSGAFGVAVSWVFMWVEVNAIQNSSPWIFDLGPVVFRRDLKASPSLRNAIVPGQEFLSAIGVLTVTEPGRVVVRSKYRMATSNLLRLKLSARLDVGIAHVIGRLPVSAVGFCICTAIMALSLGFLAILNGPYPERIFVFVLVFLVMLTVSVFLIKRSVSQAHGPIKKGFGSARP